MWLRLKDMHVRRGCFTKRETGHIVPKVAIAIHLRVKVKWIPQDDYEFRVREHKALKAKHERWWPQTKLVLGLGRMTSFASPPIDADGSWVSPEARKCEGPQELDEALEGKYSKKQTSLYGRLRRWHIREKLLLPDSWQTNFDAW